MDLTLVLHNIRSTYNVGAILRTAEGFGVKQVILSGYTPATKFTKNTKTLPHILEKTTAQIAKTALGAEKIVPCIWSDDIQRSLEGMRADHRLIFGLENNLENKRPIKLKAWRTALDEADLGLDGGTSGETKIALVLGEEVDGINKSLFNYIDVFLEIPMVGQKESFNVSVATGVALYELLGRN